MEKKLFPVQTCNMTDILPDGRRFDFWEKRIRHTGWKQTGR